MKKPARGPKASTTEPTRKAPNGVMPANISVCRLMTRPRRSSGTLSCTVVLAPVMNSMPQNPMTSSRATATPKRPTLAISIVARPSVSAAVTSTWVGGRSVPSEASTMAPATAPSPTAVISRPKPWASWWRTSRASRGTSVL